MDSFQTTWAPLLYLVAGRSRDATGAGAPAAARHRDRARDWRFAGRPRDIAVDIHGRPGAD